MEKLTETDKRFIVVALLRVVSMEKGLGLERALKIIEKMEMAEYLTALMLGYMEREKTGSIAHGLQLMEHLLKKK